MQNKNFYITGRVVGTYRTQNLIKLLLDQNKQIYYNSFSFNSQTYKNDLFSRFFNLIIKKLEEVLRILLGLFNLLISDVVIIPAMCNDSQFELNLAYFLKKKIITDYYISFYDTFILDRKMAEKDSRHYYKFIKIDKNCIQKSNITMFLNTTEANYYLKILDIKFDPNKHLIVPLCIEESIKCKLPYFSSIKTNKTFNICWWGNYIPLHGLENIIKAIKILKERTDLKFHLFLFGTNEKESEKYKKLINQYNLGIVITIDNSKTFKNGELSAFLQNNCDLVLGNFGSSEKAKNVIVNKLIEGIAMKAPILTGESIAPLEYFSRNTVFYSKNKPELIAKNIFNISKLDNNRIQKRIDDAYTIFRKDFSTKSFKNNMGKLLNSLD